MLPTLSLAVVNRKGGVGKTSLAVNLAAHYAQRGHKTWLFDLDPQASATNWLLGADVAARIDANRSIATIFCDDLFHENDAAPVHLTAMDNLYLAAGHWRMDQANTMPGRDSYLGDLRDYVWRRCDEQSLDVAIYDCPPNLLHCTRSALAAARHVLVPVPPENSCYEGISFVEFAVDQAQRTTNPEVDIIGLVLTKVKKCKLHAQQQEALRSKFLGKVMPSVIPENIHYPEAVAKNLPVCLYRPRSVATRAIDALAGEILDRVHFYLSVYSDSEAA